MFPIILMLFNIFLFIVVVFILLMNFLELNRNIVKYYDNLKWLFSILIYFKMYFESWIFNIITVADYTSVLCNTWSFRNQSKMLILCSKNINYYFQCWKQLCTIFPHNSMMNRKFKRTAFI